MKVLDWRLYHLFMESKETQLKQIHYLIAYLAKADEASQPLYATIEEALSEANLHTLTSFTCKQIATLIKKHTPLNIKDSKDATRALLKLRESQMPELLQKQKQHILTTLLKANFPSHALVLEKEDLSTFEAAMSPVEAKMYTLIASYIASLTEGLDIFVALDKDRKSGFEQLKAFALSLHVKTMELLFYPQEREIIASSLEKAAIVYVGVYYHICYLAKEDTSKA
jgi:hypothetical protein